MKRALVIGINDYTKSPLNGCVKDAQRISELISRNEDGTPNFDTKTITSDTDVVNRSLLNKAITQLFADEADMAFFFFSGHGTSTSLGGHIVSQEIDTVSMSDILKLANKSKVKECVLMLDCCYSGDLGTLSDVDGNIAALREGVTILTASRKTQVSLENPDGGLFTSLVCDALRGGAADLLGSITTASIYAHVEPIFGAWDQRPLLKTHVSRSTALRRCNPLIDPEILRELPSFFPTLDHKHKLDKTYEPDEKPKGHPNEIIFGKLQKCRASRLVVPDGEEHMYYAAIKNKSCSLTALGQFYWHLVKASKI